MGHSVEVFYQSVTGTTTGQLIAAASTNTTTANGANLLVPQWPTGICEVISAYACNQNATDTITRARLESPNLKQIGAYPELCPIVTAYPTAYVPPADAVYTDWFRSPRRLKPGESLNARVFHNGTTAADLATVVVILGDGGYQMPVSSGILTASPSAGMAESDYNVMTIFATTAVAAAANSWTSQPLTLEQPLPKGKYALVGAHVVLTTGKAFRFQNLLGVPSNMRPGGIPSPSPQGEEPEWQRGMGSRGGVGAGVWGYFTQDNIPIPEVFCQAADTAATSLYWLDVVQIE
jgi:hypothetical protein